MPVEPSVELKNHLHRKGIIQNQFMPKEEVASHTRDFLGRTFPVLRTHAGQAMDPKVIEAGLYYFTGMKPIDKKIDVLKTKNGELIEPVHAGTCLGEFLAFLGFPVPEPMEGRLGDDQLAHFAQNIDTLYSRPMPPPGAPDQPEGRTFRPPRMDPRGEGRRLGEGQGPKRPQTPLEVAEIIPTNPGLAQAVQNKEVGERMREVLLEDLNIRKKLSRDLQLARRDDISDAITTALKKVPDREDKAGVFSHVLYEVNKVFSKWSQHTADLASGQLSEIEIPTREIQFDDPEQERRFMELLMRCPHVGTVALEHIVRNGLHDDPEILDKLDIISSIWMQQPNVDLTKKKTLMVLDKSDNEIEEIDKDFFLARQDEGVVQAMRRDVKTQKGETGIDAEINSLSDQVHDILRS